MSDAPDREAIRRKARRRAVAMGLARPEQPEAAATPDVLGTLTQHPRVLRAMLITGRLTREQEPAARRFLAEAAAAEHTVDPKDAA